MSAFQIKDKDAKPVVLNTGHVAAIQADSQGRIVLACPKCGQEWKSEFDRLIELLQTLRQRALESGWTPEALAGPVHHWSKQPVDQWPEIAFPAGGDCLCGAFGPHDSGTAITCKDCLKLLGQIALVGGTKKQ